MVDVRVRAATPDDAPALAALRWRQATEDGTGADRAGFDSAFIDWVRAHRSSHTAFVAEQGSAMIGVAWLAVLPRPPEPTAWTRAGGDIQSVYVVPERRDRGVGTALIRAIVAEAGVRGLHHLVVRSGRRAVAFYRRAGFGANELILELNGS
jgi:ribosomal protein S18 acetylase RimI-like enzyme